MRILIRKNTETNELLNVQHLIENECILCEIVDAPVIEEREKERGYYTLDEEGNVVVAYEVIPPTLEEKLAEQEQIIADLMFEVAMLGGGK